MKNYSMLFQYDTTDRIYVGSVLEIPGCMAHGETQEDAMRELKIALELWLRVAKDEGLEVPEPLTYGQTYDNVHRR